MANLYDLLCYHSVTSTDPLLQELLSYLAPHFHSHIFDYIAYEHSSEGDSVRSIDSSASAFYSHDSTYFPWIIFTLLVLFFMQLQDFYHKEGHKTVKKPPKTERPPTAGKRARRLYITINPPELASNSSCSRRSDKVHAENNRTHSHRLNGINISKSFK